MGQEPSLFDNSKLIGFRTGNDSVVSGMGGSPLESLKSPSSDLHETISLPDSRLEPINQTGACSMTWRQDLARLVKNFALFQDSTRQSFLRSLENPSLEVLAKDIEIDWPSLVESYRNFLSTDSVINERVKKGLIEAILLHDDNSVKEQFEVAWRSELKYATSLNVPLLKLWISNLTIMDSCDIDIVFSLSEKFGSKFVSPNRNTSQHGRVSGPSIDVVKMVSISSHSELLAKNLLAEAFPEIKSNQTPIQHWPESKAQGMGTKMEMPLYGSQPIRLSIAIELALKSLGMAGVQIEPDNKGGLPVWNIRHSGDFS